MSLDDSCAAKERMSDDEEDENDKYLSQFVVAKVLEITQIPNKDNLKTFSSIMTDKKSINPKIKPDSYFASLSNEDFKVIKKKRGK